MTKQKINVDHCHPRLHSPAKTTIFYFRTARANLSEIVVHFFRGLADSPQLFPLEPFCGSQLTILASKAL